ncbi:MAG: hypothetical protein ACJ8FY_24420 [Gemmataceae bacterium]
MTSEVRAEGVRRDEFYGIVALPFLSLFAVVALLAFEPGQWLRILSNLVLYVAFAGAGTWFMWLSVRERKRHKAGRTCA